MTWRELLSYVVSGLLTAGLLALLLMILARKPLSGETKPTGEVRPEDQDAPVVVAVVQQPEEKKPEEKKPEEKKPEPMEKEGNTNTATAQKGMSETPVTPPEKQPMPPMPMPMPMMEKPPEMPKVEKGDPVPMPMPMPMPPMPMPMQPKPREMGNLEGVIPTIKHTGQVDVLHKHYPRREVAWVLDRNAPPGQVRTSYQFLLTPEGRLAYEDSRGSRFGEFTDAIARYDTTQLVRTGDPTQLQLYLQQRDRILSTAGLSAGESNRLIYWGWYRHRGELRLLTPAVEAFHAAVKEGKIQFDPARADWLDVQWGEEGGQPVIRAVFFLPANSPPVRLK